MAGSLHQFSFDAYNPADERRREALLALGNGMLLVRGCATSEVADGRHYPGTYRAGLYDRLTSEIEGEPVGNESLVNLPNWLPLTFRARGNSEWFALDRVQILHYRHELDVARGITWREVRFRDRCGRSTRLREERLVSLANPQLAALRVEIEPEDWTGEIEIRSALDGGIRNSNVKRYAPYRNEHLTIIGCDAVEPDLLLLTARTRQSNIEIVTAVRTRVTGDHQARELHREACSIAGCTTVALVSGAPVIEKIGAIVTSRDPAIGRPREAGLAALSCAPDFAGMRAAHESAWERLWRRSGIEIARKEVAHPTAFHQFHLLQTISPHSADLDVGFPPHGWREGYEGQIFWDDVLVFPFLSARFPNLARALLLYRYRRLDEARRAARSCGCRCAMFPWRSASTGREVTPAFQLNLLSGRWMRDDTRRQRHVGAAIALNIWQYYLATGDRDFMREHGAEMLLEIARFWASIARFDPERGRYEIRGVIGPDEFHDAYPGAAAVGIDNNAYTNVMAAWTVCRALELLDHFAVGIRDELCRLLRIDAAELALWDDVSRRLRLVFHGDGIISQFEGYQIVGGAFRLAARRAIRYGDGILPAAPSAGSGTEDYGRINME